MVRRLLGSCLFFGLIGLSLPLLRSPLALASSPPLPLSLSLPGTGTASLRPSQFSLPLTLASSRPPLKGFAPLLFPVIAPGPAVGFSPPAPTLLLSGWQGLTLSPSCRTGLLGLLMPSALREL